MLLIKMAKIDIINELTSEEDQVFFVKIFDNGCHNKIKIGLRVDK